MEAASFDRSEAAERSGADRAEGKDTADSPTLALLGAAKT
ncbi:hypothetical protein SAMN05660477_02395 [Soonwooa buanensis]|uniref:Uncharacterized protein n=1 Tax=Soonwooa buanensis TaxID=619805 RepID=A0A1T5FX78_9FLAO|nr:hypothetical protein SAMN05660477_02395 [Soonwooa buanensis]